MTFIVFEGIDGSGKSLQARLLHGGLKKKEESQEKKSKKSMILRTKEPTDNFYGTQIRRLLHSAKVIDSSLFNWEMAQLFALDRAEHLFGKDFFYTSMSEYLQDGYTIICDRYILSSFAYNGQGEMASLVAFLNKDFPVPDLTIYIDIPVEVALQRIAQRRLPADAYEQRLHHYKAGYEAAMQSHYGCLGNIVTVDGDRPVEEVHQEILSIVDNLEK